jgi:hypothetical protein
VNVLACCSLLWKSISYKSVLKALSGNDKKIRANAIELIENHVQPPFREPVTALLSLFHQPLPAADNPAIPTMATASADQSLGKIRAELADSTCFVLSHSHSWATACILDVARQNAEIFASKAMVEWLAQPRPDQPEWVNTLQQQALDALLSADQNQPTPNGRTPMSLSALEKVLFLKGVPFFSQLPGEDIHQIIPFTEECLIPSGEVFIRQGDQDDSLYIIVEGSASVIIDGVVQDQPLTSKAVIGELAMLTGEPRRASCQAKTTLLLLRLARDDFWELLQELPAISTGVIKSLAGSYTECLVKLNSPGKHE